MVCVETVFPGEGGNVVVALVGAGDGAGDVDGGAEVDGLLDGLNETLGALELDEADGVKDGA
jgi:hypothetical protein